MTKYRKKPVVIEAMQWDGTAAGATPIIEWALGYDSTIHYRCANGEGCRLPTDAHNLAIPTLEGLMLASAGDFIIKGISGEFYPCKPDIFAGTYDEVAS